MLILDYVKDNQTIIAAFLGVGAAIWYNGRKIRLDRAVFMRELFLRYNEKYDSINDGLEKLIHREFEIDRDHQTVNDKSLNLVWEELFEEEPTLTPNYISAAFDYINLCSEEYYWYSRGYIEKDVWQCWRKGMQNWYKDSFFLKNIVKRERDNNAAYYNPDFLDLFDGR